MVTTHTRQVLRDQDHASRERNVRLEVYAQLDMQFGIETPEASPHRSDGTEADRDWRAFGKSSLDELGLSGTAASRLAEILQKKFPFIAGDVFARARTVDDLVRIILEKV